MTLLTLPTLLTFGTDRTLLSYGSFSMRSGFRFPRRLLSKSGLQAGVEWMEMDGVGVHRVFWVEGAAAGFSDLSYFAGGCKPYDSSAIRA